MRRAIGRRDFLLLRRTEAERVLEVSCERLYMRWADARSGAGALEDDGGMVVGAWEGEPPTDIATASPADVLAELDSGLADADVVRVLDRAWLSDADLRAEVTTRLDAFQALGGRIE